MLISFDDLVAAAKSQCNCMDPVAAKMYYERHSNAVIIDVREPKESEESKLENSINIPRGLLEIKIADTCPEADIPIILHCGGGARASLSANTLQMMGYSNVHVIDAKYDSIKAAFDSV